MSSIIQPNYGTQAYSVPSKTREAKQTGTQANRFLAMAAQASRGRTDTLTIGMSSLMGMAGGPPSPRSWLFLNSVAARGQGRGASRGRCGTV